MKKILLSAVSFCIYLSSHSQVELGAAYNLGIPLQTMAKHLQPAHQLSLYGNYRLPLGRQQLWAGIESGYGLYSYKVIKQTFVFSDGSTTQTNVQYSNTIWQINTVLRYDIPVKGNIIPYIGGQVGYAKLSTNIYISNPDDPDGCHPLDKNKAFKDHTFTYGYGAGLRYKLHIKNEPPGKYQIDFAIINLYGGSIDYTNVRHLGNHQHDADPNSSSKPLTSRFINVNTQDIHEHQIAEIYTSNLHFLQMKLGLVRRF